MPKFPETPEDIAGLMPEDPEDIMPEDPEEGPGEGLGDPYTSTNRPQNIEAEEEARSGIGGEGDDSIDAIDLLNRNDDDDSGMDMEAEEGEVEEDSSTTTDIMDVLTSMSKSEDEVAPEPEIDPADRRRVGPLFPQETPDVEEETAGVDEDATMKQAGEIARKIIGLAESPEDAAAFLRDPTIASTLGVIFANSSVDLESIGLG